MITTAFYDAKEYDKPSFEHYGSQHGIQFRFLETKLNEDTVDLAKGCDAVCVFVNDTVNAAVIDRLYELGIKLIALRSAGYNNVDVRHAFGKIHVVHHCFTLFIQRILYRQIKILRYTGGKDQIQYGQDTTNPFHASPFFLPFSLCLL